MSANTAPPDLPTSTDNERLIPLRQVPKLKWLPARRSGSRLHYATLWRWTNRGANGSCLRTVRVGVTPCTTETWLREFFEALAGPALTPPTTPTRTPARRRREIEKAEAELRAAGVLQ